MDFIKIFVRNCFQYAYNDCLNLDNDELICLYKECLAMGYHLHDTGIQYQGCCFIGSLYETMYQYTEAIQYYKKCLQIATEEGGKQKVAHAYCNLGVVHQQLAKYLEAIHFYEKLLNIALEMGDKRMVGKVYSSLGSVYYSLAKYDEAMNYLKKSLQIAVEEGDKEVVGEANRHLGLTYMSLGKYDKAIDCHKKCLEISLEMGDKSDEGAAYNHLGLAFRLSSKHNEAIAYAEKSLKNAIALGDRSAEQHSYSLFGDIFQSFGNFHKSVEYHKKSLTIAIEIRDTRMKAYAYGQLGLAYLSLGEYNESIEQFKKSLNIAKEIGLRDVEGAAYGSLGNISDSLGKHHEAIEYYEKSLAISSEIGDKSAEARVNTNLGATCFWLGKYYQAIKYFEDSLKIATEIGDTYSEGCNYTSLGTSYAALGKYEDAIIYHKKYLKIALQSGDKSSEGKAYLSLGLVYMTLRKKDEAITYLTKCKNIVTETGEKESEAVVYHTLGDAYEMSGKYHESIEYYQKSLHMAEEMGSKKGEGKAYGGLGSTYMSLCQYDDAIRYCLKCLEIAKEMGEKEMEAGANHNLGLTYIRLAEQYNAKHNEDEFLNCLGKAERYLRDSILCYEWLFDHLHQDQYKISFLDTFITTHDYLTAVLMKSQKEDEALLIAERGRARALGDLLMLKYGVTEREDTRNSFLTDVDIETILSNRKFCVLFFGMASTTYVVAWHLSHCSKFHHIEPIQSFNSAAHNSPLEKCQENRVEVQLHQLVESSYDKMKVREAGMNCEDRSLVLEKDHDNVVNAKAHSTVQGKRSESDETNNPKKMAQNSDAHRCIPDEDLEDNIDPLPILYNGLMANVNCSDCPQDELVIVPFGALWTVPFAALPDPITGLFLSETKRIRLAPSLTSLKVLQESSADYHSKTGALIIGNPHVGEVMFRGKAKHFNNLPGAEKEAEKIGKLLNVEPFIGKQATKGTILQSLREGVAIIHFAAHGTTEGEIALTPSVTTGIPKENDYILTIKEVQESGIRPQLVVLSCCHSGRGEIKAEGVIGMSRAFLASGARAVVASLWAIDDQATMIFMEKFYSHLSGGESASVCLQKAMKGMRETEQCNKPRYWAAFFLIGDDVKINFGGNRSK